MFDLNLKILKIGYYHGLHVYYEFISGLKMFTNVIVKMIQVLYYNNRVFFCVASHIFSYILLLYYYYYGVALRHIKIGEMIGNLSICRDLIALTFNYFFKCILQSIV